MRKSKSWDFVNLPVRRLQPPLKDGIYYNYKFRINISHQDFIKYKEAIKQSIIKLQRSNRQYQTLVYRFKTPTEWRVKHEQSNTPSCFVDNGQFTIYTTDSRHAINAIRAFARELQAIIIALGIAPTDPMARDTRISANISIRPGKLFCFVDGEKQKTKFSSSVIQKNRALAEGYSLLMADTNLAANLSGKVIRRVEFDDIHTLILLAVTKMTQLTPGDWLAMSHAAVEFRRLQSQLLENTPLTVAQLDLLSELGKADTAVTALYAPVVLRIIHESIELSNQARTLLMQTAKGATEVTQKRSSPCQIL